MKSGDAYWIKIKSVRGEKFYSTLDKGNDFDHFAGDIQRYSYIRENTWECGLLVIPHLFPTKYQVEQNNHMKALGINPFRHHCYNFGDFTDILLSRLVSMSE